MGLDKRVLTAINKAIPYKILFVLTFENVAQTWIEASGTFYNSDWFRIDGCTLKLDGLNLDTVYGNLARHIAGGRLDSEGDISEAVEKDKLRQKLEREIATLEKKLPREKQFNKQVELNGELKRLKKELEELQLSDGFKFDPANMPRIDLSTNHLANSIADSDSRKST